MGLEHLGKQVIIEYFGCDKDILSSPEKVKEAMDAAALETGAHIVDSVFHHFNPHGVSGAVIISESHLTIHTWPEYGYASVDVYTCGDEVDPWKAYPFLEKALKATHSEAFDLPRGTTKKIRMHSPEVKEVFVK